MGQTRVRRTQDVDFIVFTFFHFSYNILVTNEHQPADSRPISAEIILAMVEFPIQFKQVTFSKCSFDWLGSLINISALKQFNV